MDIKKKEKNHRNKKEEEVAKKIRQCVSFICLEVNLCMPIRVEHFDIVSHAFRCSLFYRSGRKKANKQNKSLSLSCLIAILRGLRINLSNKDYFATC